MPYKAYCVLGMLSLFAALSVQAAAPGNDNFANATALSGASFKTTGTNVEATLETGEPFHAATIGGTSVWYKWMAPASQSVTLTTFGSDLDTLLAVYTGASVDALTSIASNNDGLSPGLTSRVTFTTVAGTTYAIAVDGNEGATGSFSLALISSASANDNFAASILLEGSLVSTTGTNVGATSEVGEPLNPINSGGASVWWCWIAPATGTARLSTYGSDFDTLSSLFTGASLLTLTQIGADDDGDIGLSDKILFEAVAGTTYHIRVDGYSAAVGGIVLTIAYGTGAGNVADGAPPVVNPLDNMGIAVVSSRGGLVQLSIDVSTLSRAAYNISTDFNGTSGLLGSRATSAPSWQFNKSGAFVATSRARDSVTSEQRGKARRTLVISRQEMGQSGSAPADTRTSKAVVLQSMKGKFVFNPAKPDQVSFSGTVEMPEGFDVTQEQEVSVGIGNIIDTVIVTAKGAAKDKSTGELGRIKKISLRYPKPPKGSTLLEAGQTAKLSLTLTLNDMSTEGFDTEGITKTLAAGEEEMKSVDREIQVALVIGGYAYEAQVPVQYKLSSSGETGQISGRAARSSP